MSIACDFCRRLVDRHEDVIFVESPSKLVHICEECINDAVNVVAVKKKEGKDSCSDSHASSATISAGNESTFA